MPSGRLGNVRARNHKRESHQSRPLPAPTPTKNTVQKLAKPTPHENDHAILGIIVRSKQRNASQRLCGFTNTRRSPKEMTVNHRKKSRWLHNSRRRNCRYWVRSKPSYLVVCEQKCTFPPDRTNQTILCCFWTLEDSATTLRSMCQPENSTSDTSRTDRSVRTKIVGTNTFREL